jgi:hypothetical protein
VLSLSREYLSSSLDGFEKRVLSYAPDQTCRCYQIDKDWDNTYVFICARDTRPCGSQIPRPETRAHVSESGRDKVESD